MDDFKKLLEIVNSDTVNNKQRIIDDTELYVIYHGQLRKQIEEIIYKEFQEPKTVTELKNRITPINITKKIIDKLSKVYKTAPIRESNPQDLGDNELISLYESPFQINMQMAYSNKMFKLNKHVLVVPYLDKQKIPRLRIIPSHAFSLFSDDKINPEKPTKILVHINTEDKDKANHRYEYWTDSEYWIIDGNGSIVVSEMQAINNPEGINYFGIIPHVHITQQHDLLYPIRSSDIKSIQYAVCLLLSDSALAQKYLSWGTLVIIGGSGEQKVTVGPGATLNIPKGLDGSTPEAKYLQPELNSDEVIRLVEVLIEYLLTTNSISAGSVIGRLNISSAASGVSKILDQAESIEDIHEQQSYFIEAEKELWNKFAHYILPYWVASNEIAPEYKGAFSPEFELSIVFPENKPMLSDAERIANAKAKLEAGFTTLKRAILEVFPDMTDAQAEELILDIRKEKQENIEYFNRNMIESKEQEEEENGSKAFSSESSDAAE